MATLVTPDARAWENDRGKTRWQPRLGKEYLWNGVEYRWSPDSVVWTPVLYRTRLRAILAAWWHSRRVRGNNWTISARVEGGK